ncbi:hypothetical protein DFH06DRAFT_1209306 [Mycena polygramma]|nr:hypothetical protein DFH06DRAFT_1209306 [Mycena polygramma]
MGKSRRTWRSMYDYEAHCGYFLNAGLAFRTSVPQMSFAWIAQAASILSTLDNDSDKLALPDFYISTKIQLQLEWEMIFLADDLAVARQSIASMVDLPDKIHVFVEIPKIKGDCVEEPKIYWSTDAQATETARVPRSFFMIRMRWNTITHGARWQPHHYEVAETIQRQHGFDPTTTAAARSLDLPLFQICDPEVQQEDSEAATGGDWCRDCSRNPHTLHTLNGIPKMHRFLSYTATGERVDEVADV